MSQKSSLPQPPKSVSQALIPDIELFDKHKVSFVSVTQSFNTTSSMGRLTLNVLLSFAQFEREVTGERIRDKIAASKKKGIWMGGVVPLGYRVADRKLHIVEAEADIVRLVFDLYLTHGSIRAVQQELRSQNVKTRIRVLSSGRTIGGVALTNGPIFHILTNRHYIGQVTHRDTCWPGEHCGIVESDLFEKVQQMLAGRRQVRVDKTARSGALLIGKIFNEASENMSPTYATKNGVRYRYYISVSAMQSRDRVTSLTHRVPAEPVEALVIGALKEAVKNDQELQSTHDRIGTANPTALTSLQRTVNDEQHLLTNISRADRELVADHLDRVTIRASTIDLAIRNDRDSDLPMTVLTIPWTKPVQKRRREILEPEVTSTNLRPLGADERARLLRAIARARRWLDEIVAGKINDTAFLAKREQKSERSIRMNLSLAFLDPLLIKAACEGRLPQGYGVSRLADLPPLFQEQWRALGLHRPH